MNPIQNAIQVDEELAAPLRESMTEKNPAARQILLDRVSQSLVTLAPAPDVLDPKQQVMAEQFRLLRTRVKALSKNFQLRSILVTSALAGEGKTTVAANLAGSLSHIEGLRVLLVDFDLRQPALHTVFGVEADTRSASALAGDAPWRSALYRINRRLDVLFGFHALEEPDQLLQSRRLETLLEDVKSEYDVVILDSAPLLAISDTQSLVPLVDCALFVVNADSTEVGAAREALSMLQGKVAGCVVNRVRHLKSEGYYTKSGYGDGYYGAKRTEKRK
jgi:capsular exopolysaccharide synthesis family protein